MMLALLSTFSVAGDEVKVVAFPDGSDAADLLHEARNWPFVVREIEGWACPWHHLKSHATSRVSSVP
jgi:hypothetical protein